MLANQGEEKTKNPPQRVLVGTGVESSTAMRRTIDLAVMVVIMLTVMFLVRYLLTLPIFSALHLRALLPRHHAIGFGAIFPGLQTTLPALKASGFLLSQ
jgi:hypothetical protein